MGGLIGRQYKNGLLMMNKEGSVFCAKLAQVIECLQLCLSHLISLSHTMLIQTGQQCNYANLTSLTFVICIVV